MEPQMHADERRCVLEEGCGDGVRAISIERLNAVTAIIIGCAIKVMNGLGCGFLEKVYENAMVMELRAAGLKVGQQMPIKVMYRGQAVGDFVADLLVEDCVIVELKVAKALDDVHLAQCMNYLKATRMHVCLLFNFGKPRLQWKRIVHELDEDKTLPAQLTRTEHETIRVHPRASAV